jgi:hypothetical protein
MFPIGEEYGGRRSIAVVVFLLLLVNIFVFWVELTGGESFIQADYAQDVSDFGLGLRFVQALL